MPLLLPPLLVLLAPMAAMAAAPRPHIVFVMADVSSTHRRCALGCALASCSHWPWALLGKNYSTRTVF
jgi:hypothetical protein